jgi:hypothetical protein
MWSRARRKRMRSRKRNRTRGIMMMTWTYSRWMRKRMKHNKLNNNQIRKNLPKKNHKRQNLLMIQKKWTFLATVTMKTRNKRLKKTPHSRILKLQIYLVQTMMKSSKKISR